MTDRDEIIAQHQRDLARKGGKVKSPAKKEAARKNLEKALQARWHKNYKGRLTG